MKTPATAGYRQTELGMVPENWEIKSVYELAEIRLGGTPKTEVKEYWNGDVKWASAKDISNCTSRYINQTEKKITKLGVDNSNAKILPANTLVITSRGTVGKLALLGEPMSFNQTCYGLVARENTTTLFLYYKLKNSITKILSSSYGTVFDTITLKTFDELKLSVPPLSEQHSITHILSCLDTKIELNQQMNKTLETIGQAIFKHWFIDFEFPNEEGKPYKSSGGEMVDSELGEIPKGWEVKKLGDLIYLEKGLSYKGKFLSGSGNPLINLGCISPQSGFIKKGIKYYNGDFSKRHIVVVGDVVVANTDITQKREILGSPIIVPANLNTKFPIIFTHHLYAIRFLNSIDLSNKEFVYRLMQTRRYGDYVRTYATGTTVLAIPKESILNFKFAYPKNTLLKLFANLSKIITDKIQNQENFNNLLSVIRNLLLPKLMTGKIRVPLEDKDAQ
ncbi:MAG: restriction endonuclease subunit S [Thaumarchaeota archaeon]|nr:restriction endonuclease subunit S [Nitrososphaerota archaeon]